MRWRIGRAMLCVTLGAMGSVAFGAPSDSTAELQSATLSNLYFKGAPRPSRPTAAERDDVRAHMATDSDHPEVRALREIFGKWTDGMAWAHRDSDGDGVFDFRVNTTDGKFFEGDIDLDGDGVRNVLDVDPFDPKRGGKDRDADGQPDAGFSDINRNTVPDHLDFALIMRDRYARTPEILDEMSEIQRRLYTRHKIILVERDARFTPALARAVDDVVTRVFRKVFAPDKSLSTLRAVASERQAWLRPDGGETCAMMFGATGYMAVYGRNIETEPLFLAGLLTHEITHAYQYGLDLPSDASVANAQSYFPMPRFTRMMEPFGWTLASGTKNARGDFTYFADLTEAKPDFVYWGETSDAWKKWLGEIETEVGPDYLADSRVTPHFIVSLYSMEDPLEWQADNMLSLFFADVEDGLLADGSVDAAEKARVSSWIETTEKTLWPGYRHANVRGSPAASDLRARFPKLKSDIAWLAKRYLRLVD